MQCPQCGLSIDDDSTFCPTCGWEKAGAAAPGTAPAVVPGSPAAATTAAEAWSEESDDAGETSPKGPATPGQKAVGWVIVAAVMIIELVVWHTVAQPWFRRVTHHHLDLTGQQMYGKLIVGVCLAISAFIIVVSYQPLADQFFAFLDRGSLKEDTSHYHYRSYGSRHR